MNNSQLKCHWPWFELSMSSKVKFYQVNWKAMYDLLCVFHTNFDHTMYRCWYISWNRSLIGPFWPWKWPLEWFHTPHILGQDWFHNKEATWCNTFWQLFDTTEQYQYLWENGPNLIFLTLKMTFWIIQWNISLDSWSISSPRSSMPKVKKSYQTVFEKIGRVAKQSNLTFCDLWTLKNDL